LKAAIHTSFLHASRKGKALYHAIEEGLKRMGDGRTLKNSSLLDFDIYRIFTDLERFFNDLLVSCPEDCLKRLARPQPSPPAGERI
jgi:hypothetical protein